MKTILLNELTEQDLSVMVSKAIQGALGELQNLGSSDEELLTREQAAKLLDVDLSTLHSWINKGKLISYGIGSRRYFKRSEIFQSLVELKPARSCKN